MNSTKSDISVMLVQMDIHMKKKIKLNPSFTSHIKFNSKLIKDLYVRAKTITFLKENMGVNIHDLIFSNFFLDMTQVA